MNNKFFSKSTDERFIAYFDIMGFKDRVYRSTHAEVKEVMDKVCNFAKGIERLAIKKSIVQGRGIGDFPHISEDADKKAFVLPVVFSDSILLMSNSHTVNDALKLIMIASTFLYNLLDNNVPVKGALSYGEFTADFEKSSFFGRPLVDAVSLAEEVHFYGAVLHNTFERYVSYKKPENLITTEMLNRERVPMKNRDITHSYLDWRLYYKDYIEIESILDRFYLEVSGNTRSYVDNTIRLYDIK